MNSHHKHLSARAAGAVLVTGAGLLAAACGTGTATPQPPRRGPAAAYRQMWADFSAATHATGPATTRRLAALDTVTAGQARAWLHHQVLAATGNVLRTGSPALRLHTLPGPGGHTQIRDCLHATAWPTHGPGRRNTHPYEVDRAIRADLTLKAGHWRVTHLHLRGPGTC